MKQLSTLAVVIGLVGICSALSAGPRTARTDPARYVLNMVMPEMKFTNVTLGDCLDYVRDVSGANIHVNWRAVEALNVTRETPVNVRLRGVTLRKVLALLLSEASGGDQLTFYTDQGIIEITTRELADQQLITRVYPIDDLIMEVPDFTDAPSFNLSNSIQTSGSGGSGSSSSGLFSGSTSDTQANASTKTDRADALVKLIMDTIQPDVWRDNGGTASIRYYNGNLIVTAPRSVHEALGGPLE